MRSLPFCVLFLALGAAPAAVARSYSGVCPDGSMFVVQHLDNVPCEHARIVDPSEMPPMRPEHLAHPYNWYVDQETRNPNNPYNLLDSAQKLREARRAQQAAEAEAPLAGAEARSQAERTEASRPRVAVPGFSEEELRDLVRLVALRQQVAPAELVVEDVYGTEKLRIQWAYSGAFEARVLEALRRDPDAHHVIAFLALAPGDPAEFHPNFLVVQGSRTFRPDPEDGTELGFLAGDPGPIPRGSLALGYMVVPAIFDPTETMELWWNDRSARTLLAP